MTKAATAREGLELALRSILYDDDATSAAQIVVDEGWRPPAEVDALVIAVERFRDSFSEPIPTTYLAVTQLDKVLEAIRRG